MSRQGLFVSATDTGVGKTWLGTALAQALHAAGLNVVARKPVESGCRGAPDGLLPADGLAYHAALPDQSLADITPVRLRRGLSPERAARLEGVSLSIAGLAEHALAGVAETDFLLVEGAGGLYSPLAVDGLNADLAAALALPVLLVAPDRLGVLNHVLLSLEALERRGLEPRAVALNASVPERGPEDMDNAADLRAASPVGVVCVPYCPQRAGDPWRRALQALCERVR